MEVGEQVSLKRAILATVERRRLQTIARKLDLTGDEGKLAAKVARSNAIDARHLLEHLSDKELVRTATEYRVRPDEDRCRLVSRLLEVEAFRESGGEPCLYHRGPFVALALDRVDDDGRASLSLVSVRGRSVGGASLFTFPGRVRGDAEFGTAHGALWDAVGEAEFIAAHDADQTMLLLEALCRRAGLPAPPVAYQCTYRLVERVWGGDAAPSCLDAAAQAPSLVRRARSAALTVVEARDTMKQRHCGK